MKRAPQHVRTYFVTAVAAGRRRLFQTTANAELMLDVLRTNRQKRRMEIHAFVLMPDHMHLVLTPAPDVSLEKAMQYLKGGFSYLLQSKVDVWERSYRERRIVDRQTFDMAVTYVHQNPVRAGLVDSVASFEFSSAGRPGWADPVPPWFAVEISGAEAPGLGRTHSGA